jgi:hypothetical protein
MNFKERKEERRKKLGIKERPCGCCGGSGWYDNIINGKQPKCGCCKGTGKEKYNPKDNKINPLILLSIIVFINIFLLLKNEMQIQ